MKTIKISGKDYVTVAERVKKLHEDYKDCSIITNIEKSPEDIVVVKAVVKFGGRTFIGHSQLKRDDKKFGNVALEVAETSAVGRALGFANIGLVDGIASADEMKKNTKPKIDDEPPF